MSKKLIDYFISEQIISLKLDDNKELFISLEKLRKACPCAHCSGEKDVFGNIYGRKTPAANVGSAQLKKISLMGQYAIRLFWKDGHSNGIYTFEFLEALSE